MVGTSTQFTSYPAEKHPKSSKFAITYMLQKPVDFFLYDTSVGFNSRHNSANLGSFAKVSVPLQSIIPCLKSTTNSLWFCYIVALNNTIQDGFYDAGAVRPGPKFQPLEALCKKEVDQKRPVILINPVPE